MSSHSADTKRKVEEAVDDYASEKYWDQRYDDKIEHEWYFSYEILHPLFEKKYDPTEFAGSVLEIGCGDRPILPAFAEHYPHSTTFGMDYSQVAVDIARKAVMPSPTSSLSTAKHAVPEFERMDARKMTYKSGSFDIVVDKGTIDAMMSEQNEKLAASNVKKIIRETARVLKEPGTFVVVSHVEIDSPEFDDLFGEIVLPTLAEKVHLNWTVEAHTGCSEAAKKQAEGEEAMYCMPVGTGGVSLPACMDQEEEEEGSGGTVYFITSSLRPRTRNMPNFPPSVDLKVFQYDANDSEEDGE